MLNVEFNNENFRWLFHLTNADGTENLSVSNVEMLHVVFYGEFDDGVWLRFAWPTLPEHEEIDKLADNSTFALEITPEMTATAPIGVIIVEATYRVTDARFNSGYKQATKKAKLLRMVKAKS